MAIDLQRALTDKLYAQDCYDGYKDNNKVGATKDQIHQIEDKWGTALRGFNAEATTSDVNEIEISDEEISSESLEEAEGAAEEEASPKAGKTKGNSKSDAISTASLALAGISIGVGAFANLPVACTMNLAVGLLYFATRPNANEKRALDILKDLMLQAQETMNNETDNIEEYEKELEDIEKTASEEQADATEDLEKTQEEQEMLMAVYNQLVERAKTEPLSPEDQAKLDEVGARLGVLSGQAEEQAGVFEDIQNDTTENISDTAEGLENSSSEIENALALTEECASFDEATYESCRKQQSAQLLNAMAGFTNGGFAAAIASLPFMQWLAPYAAMGIQGGVMSTAGAAQQGSFANDIVETISVKNELQSMIVNASNDLENGDEELDAQEKNAAEIVAPEDSGIEQPENVGQAETSPALAEPTSEEGAETDTNPFKKPHEATNNPFA